MALGEQEQKERDLFETQNIVGSMNNKRQKHSENNKTTKPKDIKIKQLKNGCIICISHSKNVKKYCHFKMINKQGDLHKFLYLEKYKIIPKNMCVCHNCPKGDNSKCININHLWLGSLDDNNKDMKRKGRQAKGEKHGMHKLTKKNIIKIRKLYLIEKRIKYKKQDKRLKNKDGYYFKKEYPTPRLADMFGVVKSNISFVIHNETWKEVI